MTDTFYPVATITGHHDASHAPLSNSTAYYQNQRYGVPVTEGTEEEESISCFCGFSDDDGNTVACDECNRWQHTVCYYPQYEGQSLPADLEHFCIDCRPRQVDPNAANFRQRLKRDQPDPTYNGAKRQATKSHKKKVKEPTGSPYTNGWPMDKARHDRNSASPRDQPPPAKRPKTSHRNTSDSANSSAKGNSRKRAATNANHRRSLSRSPDTPVPPYSDEFIRCYHDDDWSYTHSNLMETLEVTNTLSTWLQQPDEDFRESVGADKHGLFMRWDNGPVDDIPGKADLVVQEQHDENLQDDEGRHPRWKTLTAQDTIADGGFIGELRGKVGFKEDYKADPANRWSALRHPEPFVFFHPVLPIYVDARHEGTNLRFVRRSCHPNAKMHTIITGSEYHFCFLASQQIEEGTEIAINWDTQESMGQRASNSFSSRELDQLCVWVSNVLSNCGPCACQLPHEEGSEECSMARFDRRASANGTAEEAQLLKMPKAKRKKAGHHIPPLNTNAVSSRSGSEARKVDPDDEPTDSRSASGSAGRGSASRDMTPNTHYSANGSLSTMPELSERERKKLAKEEEMFRRQEEEQTGRKKKRNSGSSNLNTPVATTSKQFGSRYADAGTSKQSGFPSSKPTTGKRARANTTPKPPAKTQIKVVPRPKPTYVDADTQCDLDQEEADKRTAERAAVPRRKYIPLTQRLLQRCAANNLKSKAAASPPKLAPITEAMDIEHPDDDRPHSPRSPTMQSPMTHRDSGPIAKAEAAEDVSMSDAPPVEETNATPDAHEPGRATEAPDSHEAGSSHPPTEPPAPPWPAKSSPALSDTSTMSHRPNDMHIEMPPPPTQSFQVSQPLSSSITGSIAQSPASLSAPLFSPAVSASVAPSPARKKMSLSDYTRRNKAVKDHEPRGDRDSSPASVASGPSTATLQPSASEAGRNAEDSSAIDEDVRMEG